MENMNKMRETYQQETEKLKSEISETVEMNETLSQQNATLTKLVETSDIKVEAQIETHKQMNEQLSTELNEAKIQITEFQSVLEDQKREINLRTNELSTTEESLKLLKLEYHEI